MDSNNKYDEIKNNPALKNISKEMGNSEVGHLNIGAGRVVNQDLVRINKACREAEKLKQNEIMPYFLSITKKASAEGISFNDEETEVILSILKKKMSPADIKKIDMII